MSYEPYPKAMYHRTYRETGKTALVHDYHELELLQPAEDWAETPAAFDPPTTTKGGSQSEPAKEKPSKEGKAEEKAEEHHKHEEHDKHKGLFHRDK